MNYIRSALGLGPVSEPLLWLQRRETWAGDLKANLFRVCGLIVFVSNEMVNYHYLKGVSESFHQTSLALAAIWFAAAVVHQVALKNHWLPKTGSTLMLAVDVLFVTRLMFLGDGVRSSLAGVYFLIVALAALRLTPKFVLIATGLSVAGYWSVLGFSTRSDEHLPLLAMQATITTLCLIFQGLILSHTLGRMMQLMEPKPGEIKP